MPLFSFGFRAAPGAALSDSAAKIKAFPQHDRGLRAAMEFRSHLRCLAFASVAISLRLSTAALLSRLTPANTRSANALPLIVVKAAIRTAVERVMTRGTVAWHSPEARCCGSRVLNLPLVLEINHAACPVGPFAWRGDHKYLRVRRRIG
jgi:hypothetical protein